MLSNHEGPKLCLDGITRINENVAQSLSKHKGELTLNSVSIITDEIASLLANHEGDIYLDTLQHLSDRQAASLSNHKFDLGLPEYDLKISEKALSCLADKRGQINFGNPVEWVNRFKENNEISDDDEETHSEHADISIESDSLKETLEQIQNSLIEIQAQIQSNTARLDKLDFNSTDPVLSTTTQTASLQPSAPKGKLEDLSPELQKVLELSCIYLWPSITFLRILNRNG